MAGRVQVKIVAKRGTAPRSPQAAGTVRATPPVEQKYPVEPSRALVLPEVVTTGGHAPPAGIMCDNCHRPIGTEKGCGPGGHWLGLTDRVVYRVRDGATIQQHLTQDYFGTFRCALKAIEGLKHVPGRYAEAQRKEVYLRGLFGRCYPGRTLRSAPDYRLLAPRGPLSAAEYDNDYFIYRPQPHIELLPVTTTFLRTGRDGER